MQVVGRVPGVLKMTGKKAADRERAMYGEAGKGADVVSTLAFEPPGLVRWSRFDAAGKTSFITAFYCSPAGAGPCPWTVAADCTAEVVLGSLGGGPFIRGVFLHAHADACSCCLLFKPLPKEEQA